MKKICFFGSYESQPFAENLKKRLNSKNVEVIECQRDVRTFTELVKAYFSVWKQHRNKDYSIMIIPWRGIMTFPLAKLIAKAPIMWFPYVATYDALINDRKKFKKKSLIAKIIFEFEKFVCKNSQYIIVESKKNMEYYCKEFDLSHEKFIKFTWTFDNEKFPVADMKENNNIFTVLYFGTYIPFHNVKIIIETAKILENNKDIQFIFCGEGQTKKENQRLANNFKLNNVNFLGHVKFERLLKEIKNSDVCLGVFADKNIRNYTFASKLWQVLSSQRLLITRDVEVMKEIPLVDKENALLVKPNDAEDLSKAILFAKNNPDIINNMAKKGYKTFMKLSNDEWENFWEKTLKPILIEK